MKSSSLDVVQTLTLVLLLIHRPGAWYVRIPLAVIATVGLAVPSSRRSPVLWSSAAVLLLTWSAWNWAGADNHKYLTGYWCLALAIAAASAEPEFVLRRNARLLIGFTFLFASGAKLASPSYRDGAFFEFTLLTDPRFSGFARVAGGITTDQIQHNGQQLAKVAAGSAEAVELSSTPRLAGLSRILTIWTLIIELAIAAAFLLRFPNWRDPPLLLFLGSTYALATVAGFGWVLAIMGLAQSSRRAPYIAILLLIEVYTAPWSSLFGISH